MTQRGLGREKLRARGCAAGSHPDQRDEAFIVPLLLKY